MGMKEPHDPHSLAVVKSAFSYLAHLLIIRNFNGHLLIPKSIEIRLLQGQSAQKDQSCSSNLGYRSIQGIR